MRYQSNLIAPDLRPYFKLLDPPKQIMNHDAPSDPDFEPECTYFTDDEAAILYHVAKKVGGNWCDVGARFGWTGAHIMEAGCGTILIEPQLFIKERRERFEGNLAHWNDKIRLQTICLFGKEGSPHPGVRGVVIDGCHDDPEPLNDARTAHGVMDGEGVILMHDFWGTPIRRAVTWLMDTGYKCRIYSTPNGIALCWKLAGFIPPCHIPDPAIDWEHVRRTRCPEFDFGR